MTAKEASAIDRKIAAIKSEQDYVARNTAAWVQQIIIDQLEQLKPQIESEKQDYAKQLLEKVKAQLEFYIVENRALVPSIDLKDELRQGNVRGIIWLASKMKRHIDSVIKSEGKSET